MQTFMNGRRIKNPVVRAFVGLIGLVVALAVVAGLVLVALPLVIGVVVVGALAAAVLPRLRGRRVTPPPPAASASAPLPRRPGQMKRVEPAEPPRTLG